MKKTCLILAVVLVILSVVLCVIIFQSKSRINQLTNECEQLENTIAYLTNKVNAFPMTDVEKGQFERNKEKIEELFPAGNTAENVATILHKYHRIGTIPNGEILSANKVTVEYDKHDFEYLQVVTTDNQAYCIAFSGSTVVALVLGTDWDGKLIFGIDQ